MGKLYQFKSKQQIEEELIEKEYREFVNLLHSFLETQTPRYEILKIMISNNKFILYDKHNKELDDIIEYDEFDYKDILISALISFAPQKIEILQCDDHEALKEIKDIFVNKVIVA